MKVRIYKYNENSRFGVRYAVQAVKSCLATENLMAWKLFNAPNNWKTNQEAAKWCKENGYEVVA